MEYRYFVQDGDHTIPQKDFDNFEDAYDYAQEGLTTFITETPIIDGKPDFDNEDIVWSWDDTFSRDEAIANVCRRHPDACKKEELMDTADLIDKNEVGLEESVEDDVLQAEDAFQEFEDDLQAEYGSGIDEDLCINITADTEDELADFAKCVLGDNCDFFSQDFAAPEKPCETEFCPAEFEKYEDEARYCDGCDVMIPENPFDFDFEIVEPTEVHCKDCNSNCKENEKAKEEALINKAPEADQAKASKEKIATEAPKEGENLDPHKFGELVESECKDFYDEFLKLCDEIGIKNSRDLEEFRKENPGDILTSLRKFRAELGPNWNLPAKERGVYKESLIAKNASPQLNYSAKAIYDAFKKKGYPNVDVETAERGSDTYDWFNRSGYTGYGTISISCKNNELSTNEAKALIIDALKSVDSKADVINVDDYNKAGGKGYAIFIDKISAASKLVQKVSQPKERQMLFASLEGDALEDDMTDEEFIEAFGRALKEKHCKLKEDWHDAINALDTVDWNESEDWYDEEDDDENPSDDYEAAMNFLYDCIADKCYDSYEEIDPAEIVAYANDPINRVKHKKYFYEIVHDEFDEQHEDILGEDFHKSCLAEKKDDVPRNEYGDAIDYKHLCDKCAYKYDCDNMGNYNYCIPNGYCDFEPKEEDTDLEEAIEANLNYDEFPSEINFDDLDVEVCREIGGEPISDNRLGGDNVSYSAERTICGVINNYNYDLSSDDIDFVVSKMLNKREEDLTQKDLDSIDKTEFAESAQVLLFDKARKEAKADFEKGYYDDELVDWDDESEVLTEASIIDKAKGFLDRNKYLKWRVDFYQKDNSTKKGSKNFDNYHKACDQAKIWTEGGINGKATVVAELADNNSKFATALDRSDSELKGKLPYAVSVFYKGKKLEDKDRLEKFQNNMVNVLRIDKKFKGMLNSAEAEENGITLEDEENTVDTTQDKADNVTAEKQIKNDKAKENVVSAEEKAKATITNDGTNSEQVTKEQSGQVETNPKEEQTIENTKETNNEKANATQQKDNIAKKHTQMNNKIVAALKQAGADEAFISNLIKQTGAEGHKQRANLTKLRKALYGESLDN